MLKIGFLLLFIDDVVQQDAMIQCCASGLSMEGVLLVLELCLPG